MKARRNGTKWTTRRSAPGAAKTNVASTPPAAPIARAAVRDVMTRKPVTIGADAPIGRARDALLWSPFRHLPVVQNGKVVGILSDRDLLAALVRDGRGFARLRVRDVMHRDLQTISPDDDLGLAANALVAREIGALPVVEDGTLVGIVAAKDVLGHDAGRAVRAKAQPSPEPTARDLMTGEPMTISDDATLDDAVGRMTESGVRHLPVVDVDGGLVGMLSDRDLRAYVGNPLDVRRSAAALEAAGLRVADAMLPDPVRIEATATASDIAAVLADDRIGAVVVVDDADRPIGIVSYVDLLVRRPAGL